MELFHYFADLSVVCFNQALEILIKKKHVGMEGKIQKEIMNRKT